MSCDPKTRISCACGCGRKFAPVRYTHRYATRECYQMQYQKDNPLVDVPSENRRARIKSVPEIPPDWVSREQAERILGVTFSTFKDARLRRMGRQRNGLDGFSTYEIVLYFIQHGAMYPNVLRRLQRFGVLRPCSRCGKILPCLVPGGVLTCGNCLEAPPLQPTETKESAVMPPENPSVPPVVTAAQAMHPLLRLLESLQLHLARLDACVEARLGEFEARLQERAKTADADQMAAEIGYLKEAIRKATTLVEDQGIRSTAVDHRLARLEKDLGVTK